MTDIQCLCADCQFNEDGYCGKSDITIGDMTECWMYETRECEEKEVTAKRVPFNKMFSWDEFCPEYYCSNCERQIATNKEDAEKLDACPYCNAKFERGNNDN